MPRSLRLGRNRAASILAAAFALAPSPADAMTVDISFTASDFYWVDVDHVLGTQTVHHDGIPQNEVSGSFRVETDLVPDPDANEDRVTDTLLTPTASNLSIAGVDWEPQEVASYFAYVEEHLDAIFLSGVDADPISSDAHGVTAGIDDFGLFLFFDESNGLRPIDTAHPFRGGGNLIYTTADSTEFYWPHVLTITIAIDGGAPLQYTNADALTNATLCLDARADEASDFSGQRLCRPPDPEARATGTSSSSLREVRTGRPAKNARAARGADDLVVETILGGFTLRTRATGLRMIPASEGGSAELAPPAGGSSLACSKARIAPGTVRFRSIRNVIVGDGRYHLGKPTRLCVDESGASNDLLCFRARRAGPGESAATDDVWVAHELGTEALSVGRAREVCVPLE